MEHINASSSLSINPEFIEWVKALYHFIIAIVATFIYGYPARRLTVIAVSGTSGKTTTSHLIYSILKTTKKKVSLISSVETIIGGRHFDTGLHVTTPPPFTMQKFLRKAVESKSTHIVIEASSHGISQKRMLGTNVTLAVLTNIAHEHLDYHKTFASYAKAKLSLLASAKIAVINKDDQSYQLLGHYRPVKAKIFTYSLKTKSAHFTPENVPMVTKLPGDFNKENILAAASVCRIIGVEKGMIKKALEDFKGVIGRFEEVENSRGFQIIVDFAHKPNALEKLLETLRPMTKRRLIVMFGCAGERDRRKREMMGEIAGRLADISVLTAEDPRREDVNKIIEEIAKGCRKSGAKEVSSIKCNKENYFIRVPDRREAIDFVINKIAQKGDIATFLGKSHEKSMCYGKTEYPWSEHREIYKALARG